VPVISTALPKNSSLRTAHLDHLSKILMKPLCLTRNHLVSEFSEQASIRAMAVDLLDQKTVAPMTDFTGSDLDDTAVMMLTSGSTGKSKAVCLSHGQIFAALKGKLSVVALHGLSFMNWIRLDHVASLIEIHLQAIFAHKDQVHVHSVDVLSNPINFIDLIHRHRVTRTFAPNSFLAKLRAMLSDKPNASGKTNGVSRHWDLSCLNYVASGGEANVTKTCYEVSALLSHYGAPANVVVPGFGMTETLHGCDIQHSVPTT
jgi:acyl-CoA synthetase (AMP-forming)/AMP-acid ligase II